MNIYLALKLIFSILLYCYDKLFLLEKSKFTEFYVISCKITGNYIRFIDQKISKKSKNVKILKKIKRISRKILNQIRLTESRAFAQNFQDTILFLQIRYWQSPINTPFDSTTSLPMLNLTLFPSTEDIEKKFFSLQSMNFVTYLKCFIENL
ncbi:hypothetical protein BpHYR1_004970 [Brachionus plicatilis]|uniref:Uncharacterized protein n=1 Tax=Brachionus plicatilis TaxID=10195 RepID=A0A3M7T0U7_BRAPC|nr:hypothetical protein BpHYR1_004970 [Brachionus plicatilis]